MKRFATIIAVTALVTGSATLLVAVGPAAADSGVGSSKGCSPTTVPIGTTVSCHYSLSNTGASAAAGNTVQFSSIVDYVPNIPPPAAEDTSGNLLAPFIAADGAGLALTGGATCSHILGYCSLPPGAKIMTPNIPFHVATVGDYNLNPTTHKLPDQADLTWTDECNVTSLGCTTASEDSTDSAQVTITKNNSATVTAIQQGGATVTSIAAGTSVTDQATVTGSAATPTGTVTFSFFTTGNCTGNATVLTPDSTLNGSGVATSASVGPLTAGNYSFSATYNGDGTYNGSTGACEPLTVNSSATVTAIKQGGATVTSIAAGTSVTDQATVTGSAGTPTGTVTFSFFTSGNCTGNATVLTPNSTLNGSGVATSASSGPLAAGSYSYSATYNGEAGVYPPSTGACEPLMVNSSATVTAIQQGGATVTSIAAGTSVTDQATVTGSAATPTGTVTFSFFTTGNCTGNAATVLTPDSTLNAIGVATSASSGPLTPGVYSFSATYNGEAGVYPSSTGDCEPLTVNSSATVTAIQQGGATVTSIAAGTSVTDQATVTGSAATPTGTVTFSFFTTGNCTGNATVLTPDSTLNASGVATSASVGPLTPGVYSFSATYNGEAGVYPPSTGACEPLLVNSSTTVTAIQQGGATVTSIAAGTSVTDQATVTGSAATPTGTVTFTFYTSADCSTGATVLTPNSTLNGSGVATSASVGPLTPGVYSFLATYNGEAGVYPPSTGACEPLLVNSSATVTAIQQGGATVTSIAAGTSVTDQATVTGSPATPTGTVTFTFYTSADCSTGATVLTPNSTLNGSGVATSASEGPLSAGSYSFNATYNGEAGVYPPSTGTCEPLSVIGTPKLTLTKTADVATIAVGDHAGFTITITNTGTAPATGVALSDPLPCGAGSDLSWSISTQSPGSSFGISGPMCSQILAFSPTPITIAAGASYTVDVKSTPLTSADVGGGSGGGPVSPGYSVLYSGTGGHNLQITNVKIGNVGVGGTGHVHFSGPGTINGSLDFSAPNTGQYSNTNNSNVGPTSVNYNVAAVTTILHTFDTLSSSLAGLGNNLVINGNQTVNESAGQSDTVNGVTYRVFNVTSYNENDGKLLTIVGDGSGDPVVFNFGFNQNVNLGGDVALSGGLSDGQVLWNFTSTNQNIQLNNNASSYPHLAFQGTILAPNDGISIVNSNLSGSVVGGDSKDMQIVSGDHFTTPAPPLTNTATVSATNPSGTLTASATITLS